MITIEDIRNPENKSGFHYVIPTGGPNSMHGKPWKASQRRGGSGPGCRWSGPRRSVSAQAAQDYCDYINSGKAPTPKPQKAAKVKPPALNLRRSRRPKVARPTQARRMSTRERKARKVIRDELAKNPPLKLHEPVVYLVGEELDSMAVKVGYADYNVHSRLDSLQTGNPRQLVLLGTIPGGKPRERELHEEFEADNLLNEWFQPSNELLAEFDLTYGDFLNRINIGALTV